MGKLTSGRSYAVILVFDVPVEIKEGQEAQVLTPMVNVSIGATGALRVVTGRAYKDDPETVAKRLLGPVLA